MRKQIIVTGANGQLGSEIKEVSKASNHSFIYTDIDSLDLTIETGTFEFLHKIQPDYIINCAAYTAVDRAETEPDLADLINSGIPALLAKFGKQTGCKIIHISTDYVFAGDKAGPISEEETPHPKSKYGWSKLKGEQALQDYDKSVIIRTAWLYSSFGNNFVKSMIRLLEERNEIKVVFDQVGTPTYAADLASVILKIIDCGETGFVPGVYHYSNEGVTSWYDLAVEIKEYSGSKCKVIPIETKDYPLPAPRPTYSVLNKEKIKTQFGIEIPHWRRSLNTCLKKLMPN